MTLVEHIYTLTLILIRLHPQATLQVILLIKRTSTKLHVIGTKPKRI